MKILPQRREIDEQQLVQVIGIDKAAGSDNCMITIASKNISGEAQGGKSEGSSEGGGGSKGEKALVLTAEGVLDTIERIESIVIAFWVIVDFSAICVYVFILISIIKSLFSVSESKPLASPVIICAFIISQRMAKDKFELEGFTDNFSFPVSATFCFVIPFIIFIIGKIRKKI